MQAPGSHLQCGCFHPTGGEAIKLPIDVCARQATDKEARPRYSLDELLAQCKNDDVESAGEDHEWLSSPAAGVEAI